MKKAVKKLTEKPDPVTTVNEDPGPQTGAPAHSDLDEKVRVADLQRSREQMAELAHHSNEAVVAAGLPLECDEREVAVVAAVPADGASGKVGWVTARRILAAQAEYRRKK